MLRRLVFRVFQGKSAGARPFSRHHGRRGVYRTTHGSTRNSIQRRWHAVELRDPRFCHNTRNIPTRDLESSETASNQWREDSSRVQCHTLAGALARRVSARIVLRLPHLAIPWTVPTLQVWASANQPWIGR